MGAPSSDDARRWLPLSHAQRGVWLDVMLVGDPAAYQLGTLTRIAGEVDADLARQAVRVITGRHDALRLRVDRAEPRQWQDSSPAVPFRLVDLARAPDPDAAVDLHVRQVQAEGFALGDQPLFKVELLKAGLADWRLLMICHHLLGDGLSVGLVQRSWLQAYNTLLGDDEDAAPEPAPRSSYLPVIEDDAAYAASSRYAEDKAYWSRRLTPLPALVFEDRPRPSSDRGEPAPVDQLVLDPSAFARFAASARIAKATPHRALTALIGITLAQRYGASDIALGLALHRRDHSSAHVIGMLAGMMAVRCRIDPTRSLSEAVERMAADTDEDLRHQRMPIDDLGRSLDLGGLGRAWIFDVAVTIMPPFKQAAPMLGGAPVVSQALKGPESSTLTIAAQERPDQGGLTIDFGFDPGVLTTAEVGRFRDRLAAVIDAFSTRPALRVADVDGLTGDERAVIAGWTSGPVLAAPDATLPDLFEAQAARTPDALAVISDAGALTYAALNAAADRVAARLVARGTRPGAVVGVAIARSAESIVALLGVLKAGAVYLPLDPVYPAARLAGMIADASAALVLTTAEVAPVLPEDMPAILFDPVWPGQGEAAAAPTRAGCGPDDRAYVIFTSGSTGRPKGVVMAHRAVVNLAVARDVHDPIGPGDRVLAAISIGFDVSIGQLLLPLLRGATVVVAGEVRGLSPDAFWSFMTRHGVTHVNSVPSFFESMVEGAPDGHRLTRLMLGGEPLSGALAARLRARLGGTPVVNMYGPTEACIDATAYPVPPEGMDREAVLPIGRPLPNYSIHLLDPALRPVPIGAAGELFIGGAGLAQGYLGAPDLTAARFVATAWGRLYRTGDRAMWREDGTIAFLGRADAQVKIRGFRVEPAEIEAALLSHPAVAQVAVIARPDSRGALRLLAYVVARPGAPEPDPDNLRAHLDRALPAHMVPAAFTCLPALPLTPNGKLDARALPDPLAGEMRPGTAPRTPVETLLATLFGALLGVTDVGIEANFFELGGHSLLATRLAARLRENLNIELPIRTLFEAPRIVDLAVRVEALQRAGASTLPPLTPAIPRPSRLPLSFAQERLWFLSRLDPHGSAYNIPIVLRLDGRLDLAALQAAFDGLVARHESLRTQIIEVDGAPVQIVLPSRLLQVDIVDLGGAQEREATSLATAEAARAFDLDRDPLLRARLLRSGAASHLLVVTMHHIVSDGWSADVLLRDMAALYRAARAGQPPVLPPLSVHYADYALWQRRTLEGDELDRQGAYWRDALRDAPDALTLTTDFPRPARPSYAGAHHHVSLPPALGAALAAFARAEQATPFIVLLAAWAALLSRWSGQDDLVIGAPIANRTQAGTEGLIGFFVNTLALRADLAGAPSFRNLVGRMRTRALDAYAHQDFPFDKLVDLLNPQRDLARHPVFQVMFVLQNAPAGTFDLPDLALAPVDLAETTAKFDLTLTLTETPDGFRGGITYATALFTSETIARLADQFQRLLAAATADPDRVLNGIDLLSAAERRQVLVDWAGSAHPAPIATISALVEAEVARWPDAAAVIFGETVLTYADLNMRANRLAHALIARGVGPERPVGVCLERSEGLVVAALAVLKAGGVYLPLDPAYPPHRLADMLDDAGAVLVLASETTMARLPAGLPVLPLDGSELSDLPGTNPLVVDLTADNLAYVIFTSGSTGRPKGVAVQHAALANLAAARRTHDPIGPGDRVLAALSVGFDVSVGQLITPLLSGATIVVGHELARMNGSDFWDLLRRTAVSHVNAGPSFIEAVLGLVPSDLALKRLMLGGEPFTRALADKLRAALPATEIFNMYGPTEACIDATCYRATGAETGPVLPIGRPLPHYVIRILDPALQPVGIGVAGELFIGGNSLARGYLNRPELTGERFIPDPFGPDGARLYRTGDLARWRPDGTVDFLGRLDSQVKIRGFRVELGEIEAALRTYPAVIAAAVVTRARHDEVAIAAYLVARAGDPPAAQDLRRHLAASLPDHMIPRHFTWLDALPLTLNGKIDVKALAEPVALEEADAEPTPPRDGFDTSLLAIWRDVLGKDRIGIDANFFRLGGHSLLALKIASACKARLGIVLPIGLMFQHQTIRALADALQATASPPAAGPLLTIQPGRPGGRPLYCVHPAGGTTFCYRKLAGALGADQTVYGLQAAGLADGEALAPALREMARSYVEAIRTRQPQGPYRLLGHSFGGLVAFEMARQLEGAGQTVDVLVLLDTSLPDRGGVATPGDLARILRTEGLDAVSGAADKGQFERIEAVAANSLRLSWGYRPVKLRVPVTYVAADRAGDEDDRAVFWSGRSRRPTPPRAVPCSHFDMLDAPDVARALRATLTTEARPGLPVRASRGR